MRYLLIVLFLISCSTVDSDYINPAYNQAHVKAFVSNDLSYHETTLVIITIEKIHSGYLNGVIDEKDLLYLSAPSLKGRQGRFVDLLLSFDFESREWSIVKELN